MWTADAGNDGEAYYQRFGGFCESIGLHATREQWKRIKQDRSRRMHRKHDEQEVDVLQAMRELKAFLESDYIRLGHPEDEDVVALKRAIDEVVAKRQQGVWDDAVQTALWAIESAITDWLGAVLGEHDDASFQRARELCVWILAGIQQNALKTSKNDRDHFDHFCDGMAAEDKGRCGCILTDRLKSSAKHVRTIIRRCAKLPLCEEGIQRLLGKIGLGAERDRCTGRWALAGPVYACYLETRRRKNDTGALMRLCRALWSYTKDGLRLDAETCALFTTRYVLYYAVFRTIVSEARQFVDTYPLAGKTETAGAGVDEAPAGAVRPHIIVFRLIPHVSTRMLLGGMKELM
jgi:hypothetical protein